MTTTPIKEIHLGKTDEIKDLQIAVQEMVAKLNEMIKRLNTVLP